MALALSPIARDSLLSVKYNLLLGSGVSLDSHDLTGKDNLLSANALRLKLCKLKGVRESSTLQRVYGLLTEDEKAEHIIAPYLGCQAGPTAQALSDFYWRRIFTFNIDDVIENAYAKRLNHPQELQIHHFADDYVEYPSGMDLPILHLHGYTPQAAKGFVFSRDEYARFMKAQNTWMHVLSDIIRTEPFVVAGTSLDEIDLEYYLSLRSPSTARTDRGPSILVEPFPDAGTRSDCEKYGLELYEGTLLQFFGELSAHVPNRPFPGAPQKIELDKLTANTVARSEASIFLTNFEVVRVFTGNAVKPAEEDRDFFFGAAPTWSDLRCDRDAGRAITSVVLSTIRAFMRGEDVRQIHLIQDVAGGGKTTILRRCAYDAAADGFPVFFCRSVQRIEPKNVAIVLNSVGAKSIIFVDNAADQAAAINQLAPHLAKDRVLFICGERDYRVGHVQRILRDLDVQITPSPPMSDTEAQQLIEKFDAARVLADAVAARRPASVAQNIASDPIAVAACRLLNDLRPLARITESLVLNSPLEQRSAYLAAALSAHCIHFGMKHEHMAKIVTSSDLVEQMTTGCALPLTYVDGSERTYVGPLNYTIAESVLRFVSRDDQEFLFEVFNKVADAIAPYVNRKTTVQRTPEARMAGRLFHYDVTVSELIPDFSEAFYLSQENKWGWNSRFWGQRALMCLSKHRASVDPKIITRHLRDALQFARYGVSREPDGPFPLTTLGQVLVAHIGVSGVDIKAIFGEAVERLDKAIKSERTRAVRGQPYVVLFRGAVHYKQAGGILSDRQILKIRNHAEESEKLFVRDTDVGPAAAAVLSHF